MSWAGAIDRTERIADNTMDYTGKLYGKIGGRYIPLKLTSDDVDLLEEWKREALRVLAKWEQVWIAAGSPGSLGSSKAESVLKFIHANA